MPKTRTIKRKLGDDEVVKITYRVKENGKLDTGKPTKRTPEVLNKLQEALMKGCTEGEACAYANITQQVLCKWKNEDPKFIEEIEHRKELYIQAIKFASYERAINTKNRDSTDILFKVDKRYSDKQQVDVNGTVSLVDIARQMQEKRLDKEKGEQA